MGWAAMMGVWTALLEPEAPPAWTTECPPITEVKSMVAARLARDVSDAFTRIGAHGGVDDAGVWVEIVFVSDAQESTRRITAASCAEILDPVAVVVALVIDAEAASARVASSDPFAGDDVEPFDPRSETDRPERRRPAPVSRAPREPTPRAVTVRAGVVEIFAGLELGTDLVMLRRTGFGGVLSGGVWLGIVRFAALGSFWVPRRIGIGSSDRTLRAGTGGIDVCVAPAAVPVQLGACAGFEGGQARQSGSAQSGPTRQTLAMGVFGAGVWWLVANPRKGARVALTVRGSGLVLAVRPDFGEDGLAFRSRRYGARVTVGVELRFDPRNRRSATN